MEEKGEPFVLVCQNGFVLFAYRKPHPRDFMFWVLDCCHVIRRWGTTKGIGQLAIEGPQANTVLDREPDGVELLKTDVKRALPVGEEAITAWQRVITGGLPSGARRTR